MKVLVVSDTHGNIEDFLIAVKNIEKPDLLIHLGDHSEDGKRIAKQLSIKSVIIRGNCDPVMDGINEEEVLLLKGKKIFLTHGHKYNVKGEISNIYYRGKEIEADVVLFGHTHIPIIENIDDMIIMNPGSASLPRSIDKIKTFGLIEIGNNIETKINKIK